MSEASEHVAFGNEIYDTEIAVENASYKLLQAITRVSRENREDLISVETIVNKILKNTSFEIRKKE